MPDDDKSLWRETAQIIAINLFPWVISVLILRGLLALLQIPNAVFIPCLIVWSSFFFFVIGRFIIEVLRVYETTPPGTSERPAKTDPKRYVEIYLPPDRKS